MIMITIMITIIITVMIMIMITIMITNTTIIMIMIMIIMRKTEQCIGLMSWMNLPSKRSWILDLDFFCKVTTLFFYLLLSLHLCSPDILSHTPLSITIALRLPNSSLSLLLLLSFPFDPISSLLFPHFSSPPLPHHLSFSSTVFLFSYLLLLLFFSSSYQKTSTAKASKRGLADGAFFLYREYSGPMRTWNCRLSA